MEGWTDMEKGVQVRPSIGNHVNITYTGLLSSDGAEEIYLHCGYENPDEWYDPQTMRMNRTGRGWERSVPMNNNLMSFCFRDNASNWDNNSGYNWVIHKD
ncbi:MAG: hypothetical protein K9L17_12100 [Clostridiales bacterium]|nr:hypothetical protein [Clostridiales bacterium]MCF8023426.1 hypothetical protein [Clostridiales bacterium]